MDTFQLDWQGLTLPIHDATISYLGNVNPDLQWRAQGLTGHREDEDTNALESLQNEVDKAKHILSSPQGEARLKSFLSEATFVFANLLSGKESWVDEYLEQKELIFVIGIMRSAGTYLFAEVCNIHDINWNNLNKLMTRDTIPTGQYLISWENPKSWIPLIFEIAQFLVWAKKEFSEYNTIIQKRIGYAHALPIIDNIFGTNAKYLITIRHPAAMGESYAKLYDIDANSPEPATPYGWELLAKRRLARTASEWKNMSYYERVLDYWQVYYEDLVRLSQPKGEIIPIAYGKFEEFLNQYAKNIGKSYMPSKFIITERDYSDFWLSHKVQQTIEQVRKLWKMKGIELPEISLL